MVHQLEHQNHLVNSIYVHIGVFCPILQISLAVVKSEETDKKHRYEQRLHLPDGSSAPVDAPSNIVRY